MSCFLVSLKNTQMEEGVDLADENQQHTDGSCELDTELKEAVKLVGPTDMELIQQSIRFNDPTYHDTHHQCAQRHCNTFRQTVHKVQPTVIELANDTEGILEGHPNAIGP